MSETYTVNSVYKNMHTMRWITKTDAFSRRHLIYKCQYPQKL